MKTIIDYRFQYKASVCSFSLKAKNVSLTLCQKVHIYTYILYIYIYIYIYIKHYVPKCLSCHKAILEGHTCYNDYIVIHISYKSYKPNFNCFKKMPNLFHTHGFQKY